MCSVGSSYRGDKSVMGIYLFETTFLKIELAPQLDWDRNLAFSFYFNLGQLGVELY
jgi:hypothetical protein